MAAALKSRMQKEIKKMRVNCADLAIGMYVCELDRPWLESPFLLQGFYIKDREDIDTVSEICDFVYVDKLIEREMLTGQLPSATSAVVASQRVVSPARSGTSVGMGRMSANAGPGQRLSRLAEPTAPKKRKEVSEQSIDEFFPNTHLTQYSDSVNWRDEAASAGRAVNYLHEQITRLMEVSLNGGELAFDGVRKAVDTMVESVIRNPDACLWSVAVRPADNPSYDAALRASVFSVVLGRRLGLPQPELCSLGLGGLLLDIGKLRLSDDILNADRKLTDREMSIMQHHVEVGLRVLKRAGLDTPEVLECVAHHHERLDGSGYPNGTKGDKIPAFGRLAGLVDCYNAITGSRRYASKRSPAEAINQLYKLKSVHFHKDLVDEFIHAIGVYPVGALVELSTGEAAAIIAQSKTRRLRPIVLVLRDRDKNPCQVGYYIDLENTTHDDDGNKLDIVKNLEPNAYGIDLSVLRL